MLKYNVSIIIWKFRVSPSSQSMAVMSITQ